MSVDRCRRKSALMATVVDQHYKCELTEHNNERRALSSLSLAAANTVQMSRGRIKTITKTKIVNEDVTDGKPLSPVTSEMRVSKVAD